MLKNFRAYTLSVEVYRAAQGIPLPGHLRDQLRRAAASIPLNLAEGSAKLTAPDQRRFYAVALGSLRECQAVLALADENHALLAEKLDVLGGMVFRLIQSREQSRKRR
jgi:four helix bundle protein